MDSKIKAGDLAIETSREENYTVIKLRGDFSDDMGCFYVKEKLRDLVATDNPRVMLDLTDAQKIGKEFLGELAVAFKKFRERGGEIEALVRPGAVKYKLDTMRLGPFLGASEDRAQIVRKLLHHPAP